MPLLNRPPPLVTVIFVGDPVVKQKLQASGQSMGEAHCLLLIHGT